MNKMNSIMKGLVIEWGSWVLGIVMILIAGAIDQSAKNAAIQNLQGTEKIAYEMTGTLNTSTPECVTTILLIAFGIMILGSIIGHIMCECPKCGYSVMTRYGYIHKHCPNCGKKIKY